MVYAFPSRADLWERYAELRAESLRNGGDGTEALMQEVRTFCKTAGDLAHARDVHSVDWLLTAARLLLWVREGRLSSKSQAADWGQQNATGEWRELLPRAKHLRLHPGEARSAETRRWLEGLTSPTQEAIAELEDQLEARK